MAGSKRARVLVAEDDDDLCGLIEMWLAREYDVLVAHDGDEALTIAHREAPDLALVDIMMPRLSGYGVAWAFTHNERLSGIRTIFMTAYPDAAKAIAAGSRLLLKPFRAQSLVEMVAEALQDEAEASVPRPKDEHRRMDWVDTNLPAVLTTEDGEIPAQIRNISMLGAFLEVGEPPAIDGECRLSFHYGQSSFELHGRVVHQKHQGDRPGLGIAFSDLGLETERKFLRTLVSIQESGH